METMCDSPRARACEGHQTTWKWRSVRRITPRKTHINTHVQGRGCARAHTHALTLTRHTTKTSSFYGVQLRAPPYQRQRAAEEIRSRWVPVCETDPGSPPLCNVISVSPDRSTDPPVLRRPWALFHAFPVLFFLPRPPRRQKKKNAGGDAQRGRRVSQKAQPLPAFARARLCTLACIHQDVPFGVSDG